MSSQNELEQINYKQIRLLKSIQNDIAEDFIGVLKDKDKYKDKYKQVR